MAMTKEEHFETEKYRFYFRRLRTPALERSPVIVDISSIERREVTDKDKHELEEFFGDMGKWESFVEVGKSLLQDLGIPLEIKEKERREFGVEKYKKDFEIIKRDESIMVTINLTDEESSRRAWRARGMLSVEEIREQLKNVPKWQILKKTILELKEKL